MRIKWYGTASLLIEAGDTRILVDPYLKRHDAFSSAFPIGEGAAADAAFITYPDHDRFSDIGVFLAEGLKKVYVPERGIAIARENNIPDGRMFPISANEKIAVGDITVYTLRSRLCKPDAAAVLFAMFAPSGGLLPRKERARLRKMRKHFRAGGEDILAFEFSAEGKKVMVLGSAAIEENTEYPGGADLLVLPYRGHSRMHRHILPLLGEFSPKAVMIDCFDDVFPSVPRTVKTEKFVSAVEKRLPGSRAIVPVPGEWYEI